MYFKYHLVTYYSNKMNKTARDYDCSFPSTMKNKNQAFKIKIKHVLKKGLNQKDCSDSKIPAGVIFLKWIAMKCL